MIDQTMKIKTVAIKGNKQVNNVTIVILTKNEEKRIADTIRNALSCSQNVLIVDAESMDKTVSIAKQLGAKVVIRAWTNDFAAQRNFALKFVKTDWVLYLDADEMMDETLIQHVQQVVRENKQEKIYRIKRKAIICGQACNHGAMRPDYVARLFPTKAVTWVNPVHEHPETKDLEVGILAGHINHYTYDSWEQYWKKFNQYTTIWADEAYRRGKKTNLGKAFVHATFGYLKVTIIDRGFLDGWLGLAMCANHFSYTLVKYMKLQDRYRQEKVRD